MSNPPPPPPRPTGGLSLYANLLDDSQSATKPSTSSVSGAPVLYPSSTPKRPINASLQFQPLRRPQPSTKPGGPKPGIFPKSTTTINPSANNPSTTPAAATVAPAAVPAPPSTTLADWANLDDDGLAYSGHANKRRRKKKTGGGPGAAKAQIDWGEIYDPTRPTNVDEYLASDERVWEIREWRAVLYRRRQRQGRGGRAGGRGSDEEEGSESEGLGQRGGSGMKDNRFAPPPTLYAPPQSPPAAPASIPDDATGDDAYARRLALSQNLSQRPAQPPPPPPTASPIPPSSETYSATISSAPILYALPQDPPITEPPPDDDNAPRSSLPGQAGFAQRLMAKHGWTAGTGLGATSSGITSALQVKQTGSKTAMGAAKIVGGRKRKEDREREEAEGYGKMSDVVVLRDMLEGMEDLEGEIAGGLGQEIGEECGDKYGRVERLKIDVDSRQVFIKFTDSVSALRAVSELNGRVFSGNVIVAKFYDSDKFGRGVWK